MSSLSVGKVNDLLRRMFEDRIAELKRLQLNPELSSAAHTVLTIRIDECNVLLTRWGLND